MIPFNIILYRKYELRKTFIQRVPAETTSSSPVQDGKDTRKQDRESRGGYRCLDYTSEIPESDKGRNGQGKV